MADMVNHNSDDLAARKAQLEKDDLKKMQDAGCGEEFPKAYDQSK